MAGMDNMESGHTDQLIDWIRNRYFGKYRGLVTDNNDPTSRGRLKVRVPAVLGDLETWAMPCLPFAGAGMGAYLIPEKDAGIWVEFEAGDPSYAIWIGGFWADGELPKNEKGKTVSPPLKIIKSAKGMLLALDDESQTVALSDKNGKNLITIDIQAGKISIKAKTKVVVEGPQIELTENATHAVVFGDELMNYLNQLVQQFNTHMHPGEMAAGFLPVTPTPPMPPVTPPSPSLMSTKVKAG